MSTVLVSVLGKAGLGIAKKKINSIWQGTSLSNAIRFTSLYFHNDGIEVGPALDRWTKSPSFEDIADRMARHDGTLTDEFVVDSFIKAGDFDLSSDDETSKVEVA